MLLYITIQYISAYAAYRNVWQPFEKSYIKYPTYFSFGGLSQWLATIRGFLYYILIIRHISASAACRNGWLPFEDACYLIAYQPSTWAEAEVSICKDEGGHVSHFIIFHVLVFKAELKRLYNGRMSPYFSIESLSQTGYVMNDFIYMGLPKLRGTRSKRELQGYFLQKDSNPRRLDKEAVVLSSRPRDLLQTSALK